MVDFNELKKEVDKQLKNCAPFFQDNRLMVFIYIVYVCEKLLGKKKYDFTIIPTNKDGIMIDISSARKNLKNPIVITKQKIKRHAKLYELPE